MSTLHSTFTSSQADGLPPQWYFRAAEQPGTSAFIEIDGIPIHYLSWGMEHGERPALLLIHGFRAHAHWWDFIAPFFAEQYRVIAMDLSGMGDSGHRPEYTVDLFARDITGLVEALDIGPVIAVGHSYGGARLLRACADRNDLFRHLVIVDSFVRFRNEPGPPPLRKHLGNRVHANFDEACTRYRLMPEQPVIHPALLTHMARHALRKVEGGWQLKFDATMATNGDQEIDADDLLQRITKPVDIIHGEHSRIVSAAAAQRLIGHIPHARGPIAIPDAHHHVMLDQPLALVATLRALLTDYAPTKNTDNDCHANQFS